MSVELERYFKPAEVAEKLAVSEDTVRRTFAAVPGVLKLGAYGRRKKRDCVMLRIPESVLERFVREHTVGRMGSPGSLNA
jgi:hypothetical protein